MTAEPIVLFERSGGIGFITLNRPSALNAINLAMRGQLVDVVRAADADPEVRVIVFRGAGPRAFCVGADIKEFVPNESLDDERRSREPPNWNDVIASCDTPTIASIHGFCLGGGLELALSCDIRIAATDAVFGLPEVRLAIIPGAGGTQRLPRVVGIGNALRLILTGDRISADEAWRIHLVSELAAPAELEQRTLDLAGRLLAAGPLALAYAKQAIRRGMDVPLEEGRRIEADLATMLVNTRDRAEGAAAFREGRTPRYEGR